MPPQNTQEPDPIRVSKNHGTGKPETRILVVEDDPDDFLILKTLFSGIPHRRFKLDRAATYDEAILKLATDSYDVCLLDYSLQGKNGLDFIREAKTKGYATPILFLTGRGDYEVDVEAMHLGASDFLHKNKLDGALLERSIRYAIQNRKAEEALRHREEFFRTILENALDGVAIVDGGGKIRYLSPAVEKILGYPVAEKLGGDIFTLLHPGETPQIQAFFERVVKNPSQMEIGEFLGRHKDGHWRMLEITAQGRFFTHPDFAGIVLNFRDINERKKAQEATSWLANILRYSNDGIVACDLNGLITHWNKGAEEVYGYTEKEVLGKPVTMLLGPENQDENRRQIEIIKAGKSLHHFESVRRKKGGQLVDVSISISPHKDANGKIIGLSAIVRDITERKKTLEAAARLGAVVEFSNDAIYTLNPEGVILSWNPGARKIFGYTAEEVGGRDFFLLLPHAPRPEILSALETVRQGKAINDFVAPHQTKDGRPVLLSLSLSPILDSRGNVSRVSVIGRDITESKRVQSIRETLQSERDQLLERLQLQMERMPIACILSDQNFHFTYWNPAAERIFGYSFPEVEGKGHKGLIVPEAYWAGVESDHQRIARGDMTVQARVGENIRKDGKIITCEWYNTPLQDAEGHFLGVMSMALDVTERRKAAEVQSQLGAILQQTTDAVFGTDLEGNIYSWNRGAERMFGYTLDEVLGRPVSTLAPPDRLEEASEIRERVRRGEEISNFETVRVGKGGEPLEVSLTLSTIQDSSGKTIGVSTIARDITERKKRDIQMAFQAAIVESSEDAIIAFTNDGRIYSWNKGAERTFGFTAEEMIGQTFEKYVRAIVPDELQNDSLERFKLLNSGKSLEVMEARRRNKNGEEIYVTMTLSTMHDANGKVIGQGGIIRDVTEKKKAEESLRRHEEQMRQVEKMNAIGRLAGGVAHDFNNLLSVIGGNAEFLLSSYGEKDPKPEELGEILKAVQRGAELAKQLLVFGQKQVSQPQQVNLNHLTAEMSKMFKRLLDADIDLAILQDKDLKPILGDPGQMQQIILNLVLNARDAMPKGGHLILETRQIVAAQLADEGRPSLPSGDFVRLSVTDTGFGMNEEVQKHVFEPFFTTKAGKGTGLGLATVYGLVQKWSGHIFLHSAPGMGTTFTLYFPALEATESAAAKPRQMDLIPQGSETVLVAEDEEPVRKIVVRTLEKYGYRVLDAPNGIEALQKAWGFRETIHLLLTDTVMPKLNGKELADELKKTRPKIKVIFVSGYPKEILSQQGVVGADVHLLQKPFELDDLARQVRKVLDGK